MHQFSLAEYILKGLLWNIQSRQVRKKNCYNHIIILICNKIFVTTHSFLYMKRQSEWIPRYLRLKEVDILTFMFEKITIHCAKSLTFNILSLSWNTSKQDRRSSGSTSYQLRRPEVYISNLVLLNQFISLKQPFLSYRNV